MKKNLALITEKTGGKQLFKVKDTILNKSQVLTENKLVKRAGIELERTDEQELEYIKCKLDPIYFCREWVRILTLDHGVTGFNVRDYQEEIISTVAKERFTIVLTGRQQGKCVTSDTLIKIRNKNTGEIKELTIGEFHQLQNKDAS